MRDLDRERNARTAKVDEASAALSFARYVYHLRGRDLPCLFFWGGVPVFRTPIKTSLAILIITLYSGVLFCFSLFKFSIHLDVYLPCLLLSPCLFFRFLFPSVSLSSVPAELRYTHLFSFAPSLSFLPFFTFFRLLLLLLFPSPLLLFNDDG